MALAMMACPSSLTFSSSISRTSIFIPKTPPLISISRSSPMPLITKACDGNGEDDDDVSEETVFETWREFKKLIKQKPVHIPVDQRWMFTLNEAVGPDIWNKTWYPKAADHVNTDKTWYVVDATDLILGRLASTIAIHIRGKNLATYTPSVDMGAFVVVVNADKVAVSGKKRTQKLYRRHSGRPGGMKEETFDQLQKRIPERIVEHAVRGMLPKGRLGRYLFNHLKVYKGPDHPHQAQQPIALPIRDKKIRKEN